MPLGFPVSLDDIRKAVQAYVKKHVGATISPLTATKGTVVDPDENFTFSIIASNNGDIAVENVRFHVWLDDPSVATLMIPDAPLVARSGAAVTAPQLPPGTGQTNMYIFPAAQGNRLEPGNTFSIDLRGKAGNNPAGGDTTIRFEVIAEVDKNYLFPSQQSLPAEQVLSVFG